MRAAVCGNGLVGCGVTEGVQWVWGRGLPGRSCRVEAAGQSGLAGRGHAHAYRELALHYGFLISPCLPRVRNTKAASRGISSTSSATSCRCSARPRRSAGATPPTLANWLRNWSALRPLPMTRWDPVVQGAETPPQGHFARRFHSLSRWRGSQLGRVSTCVCADCSQTNGVMPTRRV